MWVSVKFDLLCSLGRAGAGSDEGWGGDKGDNGDIDVRGDTIIKDKIHARMFDLIVHHASGQDLLDVFLPLEWITSARPRALRHACSRSGAVEHPQACHKV